MDDENDTAAEDTPPVYRQYEDADAETRRIWRSYYDEG